MKKNIYIIIVFSIFSFKAVSQVSINTEKIKGAFYIDALGNDAEQGSVIVSNTGNLGIGTTSPSEKIEVNGNILIHKKDTILGNALLTNNIVSLDTLRINNSTKLTNLNKTTSRLELVSDNVGEAFRFDNGTQVINNIPSLSEMIPVLTKNSTTGLVEWQNLPSVTQVRVGELLDKKRIATSNASRVNITSSTGRLTLDKGLWLVLAATSTDNNATNTSTGGFYVYMNLIQANDDTSTGTLIAQVGYPTEYSSAGVIGYGVSTPQLIYPLYVDADNTQYRIDLSTSAGTAGRAPQYQTSTSYIGGSYFYAIKLDYTN